MAVAIASALGLGLGTIKVPRINVISSSLRVREFDRAVLSFLTTYPRGTVVSLGCGLESRSFRLDNGTAEWYDLDLAHVIDQRKAHFPKINRHHLLASSALSQSWMAEVLEEHPKKTLLLAEGVFMYLEECEVRTLILALHRRFPGAGLIFDACSPLAVAFSRWHPSLRGSGNRFKWGLRNGREIEHWDAGIRLLKEWLYFDRPDPNLGWYRLLRFLPPINHLFRILHFRLGGVGEEKFPIYDGQLAPTGPSFRGAAFRAIPSWRSRIRKVKNQWQHLKLQEDLTIS